MAATPVRIGFIMTDFRRAIAESPTAKARYGDDARQSDDPIESYFDSVADAQAIADERQALLSVERRRFKVTAKAVDEIAYLDLSNGVPVARFIDRQSAADRDVLISEIIIDLAKQSTTTTLWG
ncbi:MULTISPECIES: hypothetical protein [unclassified Novosphingobium]|uniref:hypothetical protein n=1 Tax=unclassified Novosphingobium TaxID=2644732 RepID=UPI000D2FEC2A|nr:MULTISPECIES: hypothetical protein [unclassified Novosphingobium]PTR08663.1 hypothetical protein C8K11_111109 [Novosphingobium sp. GV055]PUB01386.1 hypothetical protein C8K12_111109 [Novosphingobium sp. GV061]PUB16960.1 hypothetical protein C8K14_111109 [Novosphingobium sp. GV079]PUB39983.1 hypothetical protein C8K10_111109 [Novosphingobium sp. GV027]